VHFRLDRAASPPDPERCADPSPLTRRIPRRTLLRATLVALDVVASGCAWTIAVGLVADRGPRAAVALGALFALVTAAIAGVRHLYRARHCVVQTRELVTVLHVCASTGGIAGLLLWWTDHPRPWAVAATGSIGAALAVVTVRTCFRTVLTEIRRTGRCHRRVAIVGAGTEAREVAALFEHHPELGFTVVGCVTPQQGRPCPAAVLGTVDRLASIAHDHRLDGVVVAGDVTAAERAEAVQHAHAAGLHVQFPTAYPGIDRRRLVHHHLMHVPFAYVEPTRRRRSARAAKRLLDLVLAAAGVAVSVPLWGFIAIAIKLDDGGPVFFAQERVGLHRRPFRLRKFRTMTPGSEDLVDRLRPHNTRRGGPLFKADHDPRVTRVGRWLRASSLDELPQLLNVLAGHMSIVGPRPALPTEVEQFDEDFMARFDVRPGITGLWQLRARDNSEFSAYRRLDLHYVENWSLTLDLAITVATAWEMLVRPLAHRSRTDTAKPSLAVVPGGESRNT